MAKDKNKKPKDKNSVRNRKKSEGSAVQKFLPIAEIKQDTIMLKNGGIRAVLDVSSMNFSLKSEDEQQAIVNSHQEFLNTLTFPLQVVVRSSKLNVDGYIADLEDRASKQKNPLLKEQTMDYARFIDRLIDVSGIMQKKFYVIIPVDPPGIAKASFFSKYMSWLSPSDTREKALARKRTFEEMNTKMRDRVNIVKSGLENIGLTCERLPTQQLIELFYKIFNPETSQEQKLPGMGDMGLKDYVL
jgi:type IV secretory pathway VirB4 component